MYEEDEPMEEDLKSKPNVITMEDLLGNNDLDTTSENGNF
jgi:hypothetical protein